MRKTNQGYKMSLDYNTTKKELYTELTEVEQQFYHNSLPFLLSAMGVPRITKKVIPELMFRVAHMTNFVDHEITQEFNKVSFWLKFEGFHTNSSSRTSAQFKKQIVDDFKSQLEIEVS